MCSHTNTLSTPIAFIIFNRPTETERSFAQIANAKPTQLFVIADGPRQNHPTDAANCAAARAIVEKIDWECTVHRNYSEQNLGCKRRVSSGIDWVFSLVEEAIILEDDILVDPSFFRFAEEMLDYYRQDTRIMHIAGLNPIAPLEDYPFSYFLGVWPLIWGWATWRRAWQAYDVNMSLWSPELRLKLERLPFFKWTLFDVLDTTHRGGVDTWDYQWLFANILQSGLTVVPRKNLVRNIGFGLDATHTKGLPPAFADTAPNAVEFPLSHPPYTMVDVEYQKQISGRLLPRASKAKRLKHRLRSLFDGRKFTGK